MTIERLRDAVRAEPFRPFTILTADGRRYRVTHPELVSIAPQAQRTFVVAHGREDYTVLDLLLVSGLQYSESRNGRRRAG